MSPEMYDKIQIVQQGDQVFITNNTNTFHKIEKITKVENKTIHSLNYIFNKFNLTCINDPYIYMKDIYFNVNGRIKAFLENKNYSINTNNLESDRIIMFKYVSSTRVDIRIYKHSANFKHTCYVIIYCNDILLFCGDIFKIEDFETIYKCTLSKFDKK